jgi:membrane-bound metal-dependent hydrolase YbcI (DUF457 family)
MRGVTHLAGGLFGASFICMTTNMHSVPAIAAGLAVSGVAALVPDWVNVAIPGIRIKGMMGHRGFTHWALTAAITSASVFAVQPGLAAFWLVGYASHLILDMLTKRGAPVLWPLPWQVSLMDVTEGSWLDTAYGVMLFALAALNMYLVTR